ncbi:MAG: peptidylprolyl isomerase [Alcanivoracaceae bacterium]|jgi:peptidyl-prolyl cis-trans isomerase SurA|nr:peptidylprolyl isomerase [Alcanivoracaceae bacterium]
MIRTISLAVLLMVLASTQPASAEVVLLDKIAAVVDDSVIMASELDARVADIRRNISAEGRPAPPDDILRTQVLERMIVERIQADQANRLGIRIDDTSLNEALTGIARQNGFSLEEFASHLASEGYQWPAFREQLRSEMAINQLRQRRVSQRVRITDGELDRFMSSEQGRQLFEAEFRLGHIMVAIPDGSSEDQLRSAEQRANDIMRRLRDGADFSVQAAEFSDGQSALEGGDLGWRPAAQWPSLFADAVIDLQAGELAGPLPASNGFHILKMIDRRGDEQQLVDQYLVRHILIRPTTLRSNEDAIRLSGELHDRIIQGEDMARLAREFSDDPGSARSGGSLEWVSPGEMVGEFDQLMQTIPVGQVSDPFRTEFGWHILRVEDVRRADMSEEYRRMRARQALHQRRFAEELELWLAELRQEAYVDIRL